MAQASFYLLVVPRVNRSLIWRLVANRFEVKIK